MTKTGQPKERVLKRLEKSFALSLNDMRQIIKDFHSEMKNGLAGRPSSLKMIPTHVDIPTGDEKGKFIALDLGGTNFRILELELKGTRQLGATRTMKFVLDKRHITGSGEELFNFIARSIKDFIKREKMDARTTVKMGFTFSFPVEQTGVASGRLLRWTKSFSASGVIGKDVVKLLNEALARQGVANIEISALANDTVGTMVARSYEDPRCDIGVIIGTGTNACYREDVSSLPKWKGPFSPTGHMIINTEWGNFDKLKLTPYDRRLDRASTNRGQQILEKAVSGMYLGELVRLILKDLIKWKIIFNGKGTLRFGKAMTFPTEWMSIIHSDKSKTLSKINEILKRFGIAESMLSDRQVIKRICAFVSRRAGRISASAIAAVVTKIDPALSKRHTVAVDGSVFEKHPSFAEDMRGALVELFGPKSDRIKMALTKDGSGKGAAIIAAVAAFE